MLLFVALTVVLMLYYISRLLFLFLGAVISPLIFLFWALPAGADFAKIAMRQYIVAIFTVLIHVVTIQLAASLLTVTNQSGTNSLVSILVGIALFSTLIKIPGMLINMTFYAAGNAAVRAVGGQIMNVFSASKSEETIEEDRPIKKPRQEVAI